MEISNYHEDSCLMPRACKAARLSWDSEHKSDSELELVGEADLKLMLKLARAGSDHSAAYRQAVVHFRVKGSRGWWQHMAKYRQGVEMYSASLMHTGTRKDYHVGMFRGDIDPAIVRALNKCAEAKDLESLTNMMPEGYEQERSMMMSYPAMRSIYQSRAKHRKPEWREFLSQLLEVVKYPEFLTC